MWMWAARTHRAALGPPWRVAGWTMPESNEVHRACAAAQGGVALPCRCNQMPHGPTSDPSWYTPTAALAHTIGVYFPTQP